MTTPTWIAVVLLILMVAALAGAIRLAHKSRHGARHHRYANGRFMKGYQAGYRAARAHERRATVGGEAP